MIAKPDGGPAHPTDGYRDGKIVTQMYGMKLRDWFAGQALAGLCAALGPGYTPNMIINDEGIAEDAYNLAYAMLAEREK